MVPADWVNVPPFVQLPKTWKLDPEVTVPDVIVSPWKIKLVAAPPLLTIDPPVVNVMVPPLGAKVIPELTVRAPPTENEVLYCD
jgi:hypothetical protein